MIFDVPSWKVEQADSSFPKISQSLHCEIDFPLGGKSVFPICLVYLQCLSFHGK